MLFTLNLAAFIQVNSARLQAQIFELDQKLSLYYGAQYRNLKKNVQTVDHWYQKTKAEAEANKVSFLEEKQENSSRIFAKTGSQIARKEAELAQKLKKSWNTIANR